MPFFVFIPIHMHTRLSCLIFQHEYFSLALVLTKNKICNTSKLLSMFYSSFPSMLSSTIYAPHNLFKYGACGTAKGRALTSPKGIFFLHPLLFLQGRVSKKSGSENIPPEMRLALVINQNIYPAYENLESRVVYTTWINCMQKGGGYKSLVMGGKGCCFSEEGKFPG